MKKKNVSIIDIGTNSIYRFIKENNGLVVYYLNGILTLEKHNWVLFKDALFISRGELTLSIRSESELNSSFSTVSIFKYQDIKNIFCKNFSELYDMLKDE